MCVSKWGQSALEKVPQFKWPSIKQTIEERKVYTHFSFDVFSDTVNDIMAVYPGKMEENKLRIFFKEALYRNSQNQLTTQKHVH